MPVSPIFSPRRILAFASVALACSAWAQTASVQMPVPQASVSPSNPQAKVPAVVYRSVFKETALGVEKDSADWRKANDEVGKFTRGHVDILKWEEQESAKAMKEGMEKPTAKPTEKPMDKPAVTPSAGTLPAKPDAAKPIAAPAHKH